MDMYMIEEIQSNYSIIGMHIRNIKVSTCFLFFTLLTASLYFAAFDFQIIQFYHSCFKKYLRLFFYYYKLTINKILFTLIYETIML